VDGPSVYGYAVGSPAAQVDPSGENAAAGAGAAALAVLLVRWCAKNKAQCSEKMREAACKSVNTAKLVCRTPSCDRGRTDIRGPISSPLAQSYMRATEMCLLVRDFEQASCPENFTSPEKHKQEVLTRSNYENKAKKCHGYCPDASRWYR